LVTRGEARTKILDAAEKLFATHGVDGISLRGITTAVGVGASVLHYHFDSIEALLESIILRHMEALMAQRREMIQALRDEKTVSVSQLVEVLVLPIANLAIEENDSGLQYVRLIARLYSDRNPVLEAVTDRKLKESQLQVIALLRKILPKIPSRVLDERLNAASHTLLQVLGDLGAPARSWQQTPLAARKKTHWKQVGILIEFISAGLSAPHTAKDSYPLSTK
jgi:AcrR family transcriptional regulator